MSDSSSSSSETDSNISKSKSIVKEPEETEDEGSLHNIPLLESESKKDSEAAAPVHQPPQEEFVPTDKENAKETCVARAASQPSHHTKATKAKSDGPQAKSAASRVVGRIQTRPGMKTRSQTRLMGIGSEIWPLDSVSQLSRRHAKVSVLGGRSGLSKATAQSSSASLSLSQVEAILHSKSQSQQRKSELEREQLQKRLQHEEELLLKQRQSEQEKLERKKRELLRKLREEEEQEQQEYERRKREREREKRAEEEEFLRYQEEVERHQRQEEEAFQEQKRRDLDELEFRRKNAELELEAALHETLAQKGATAKTRPLALPKTGIAKTTETRPLSLPKTEKAKCTSKNPDRVIPPRTEVTQPESTKPTTSATTFPSANDQTVSASQPNPQPVNLPSANLEPRNQDVRFENPGMAIDALLPRNDICCLHDTVSLRNPNHVQTSLSVSQPPFSQSAPQVSAPISTSDMLYSRNLPSANISNLPLPHFQPLQPAAVTVPTAVYSTPLSNPFQTPIPMALNNANQNVSDPNLSSYGFEGPGYVPPLFMSNLPAQEPPYFDGDSGIRSKI